jgi:aspartate aminotransferase/aminotransferase
VSVSADDVVFTVGGHHAIAASFAAFRSLHPGKKVVVSYPVYPAYSGWSSHENQLVKVDTMPAGGIFSAEALQAALQRENPAEIGMFVFCSPNNPCGYVIASEEWLKIAPILRQFGDSIIMLDEAYMEMSFDPYTSLLSVAPDLHGRIILVRSGTKGFSASGERMAIAGNVAGVLCTRAREMLCACAPWCAVVGSAAVREKMREYIHESTIHAPRSAQCARICTGGCAGCACWN